MSYARAMVGLLALALSAPDAPVKGARISLVTQPAPMLNLAIQNHRDSPMVEWQIEYLSRDGRSRMTSFSDFSGRPSEPPSPSGPIQPQELRTLEVELRTAPDAETAALRLAVFEDGYYEGEPATVERWRTARRERVDDLAFWIGTIESMPRDSAAGARNYLATRARERAGQVARDFSGIADRLQAALRSSTASPFPWRSIDRLLLDARGEHALLTRQPAAADGGRATGAVTAATIESQQRMATIAFVASVTNLRDVPIEAFGFQVVDPATMRPRSDQGFDFCLAPDGRGDGPLDPHETREFQLSINQDPNAPQPIIRFTFVLYDDLSFEGRAADRDELLRDRESRADDDAFALAVLAEAAALPPGQAGAFLQARRADRARQLQGEGRKGDLFTLDDLIRQAQVSPDRISQVAQTMTGVLERQRTRLLRHLER
jgi:hypothetical protein